MILDDLFQFLLAWVTGSLQAWRRRRLVRQAQTWRQAWGGALGARPSLPIWAAEITSSYVVLEEYYARSASLLADDKRHAAGLALGWEDREILVCYSPGEPTQSTLLLEDQRQAWNATPKV
jgi:hypothetical protein